mmetsp:Transcript_106805/g.195772  ORF Transcript_106805/g.195772 Transcript_106805/m.195772 type:complete len:488 (-) Transcript_106805:215-1678(-)
MSAQFVTSELDLNDLSPYPLTKESACALQQELRDQFSTASFQARLREVEDVCNPASTEFKKLQQELVFDVQRQIIPKYGFQASLDGVGEMRLAFKRQFSEDQEVSANTEAINRLIAKTSDPESEVERAAILELTRERALSLQEELRTAFSGANFQSKLSLAESAHGHGTLEFKKVQQELIRSVQRQVLPDFGYEPSDEGVAEMRRDVNAFSDASAEVSANIEAINKLIGKIPDPEIRAEFREAQLTKFKPPVLVAKESDNYQVVVGDGFRGGILVRLGEGVTSLAHRQPLSKGAIVRVLVTIGNRANFEKVSGEGPNYGWVSLHVRNKPLMQKYVGKIVLERQLKYLAIVDAPIVQQKVPAIEDKPTLAAIEDVPSTLALVVEEEKPVELKRDEALSLQNELRSAFSTRSFQERLQQCIEELIPPSLPFRKAQHELIFEVQKRILPKWGFKASLEGVADMRKAVQKHNHNYPPISANIAIINRLIGK